MKTTLTTMVITAAACACLVGCGSTTSGDDDDDMAADAGAEADAGDDSDADVTPTSGVCEVHRAGATTDVIFHDADGAPLAVVPTASGVARYDACVPDGMVTLVNPLFLGGGGGTSSKLVTVQGVQIGDVVVFDPALPEPGLSGPVSVEITNADDDASVAPDNYVATIGQCMGSPAPLANANGGTISADDVSRCAGNDATDLAVVSIARSALGEPRGLARIDINDLSAPISATGGEWVAYGSPTLFGFVNWPAGASGAFATVSPLIDGVSYGLDFGGVDPGAETMSRHVWPSSIADAHRFAFAIAYPGSYASSTRVRSSTPPALNVDLAELMFARADKLVLDVTDKARPVYSWEGGDDRAVFTRVELHWTDADHTGTWILVAPGNPRAVEAPAVPDEHAGAAPLETAQVTGGRVILADKGISFAEWLEQGIDTRSSAETINPLEISNDVEREEMTIRYTGWTPN